MKVVLFVMYNLNDQGEFYRFNMATASEPSLPGEKMSKFTSPSQNLTQYEPKRSKVPKVDPMRTLEPARKKVSTVEAQRVLHTLLDAIKKLEIAVNMEYIIDNIERFNVAFGKSLIRKFVNHQQLLMTFDNHVQELKKLMIEQRQKRIRELKRRVRRGSDISGEEDAFLLEQDFGEEIDEYGLEGEEDIQEVKDEGKPLEQGEQEDILEQDKQDTDSIKERPTSEQPDKVLTPRPPSTNRPSSSRSSARRTAPTSPKSESSTNSRLNNCINELHNNFSKLNLLISDSTRNIQRSFTVDPGAYDAFHKDVENDEIEYDAEVEEFLKFIYQLRVRIYIYYNLLLIAIKCTYFFNT